MWSSNLADTQSLLFSYLFLFCFCFEIYLWIMMFIGFSCALPFIFSRIWLGELAYNYDKEKIDNHSFQLLFLVPKCNHKIKEKKSWLLSGNIGRFSLFGLHMPWSNERYHFASTASPVKFSTGPWTQILPKVTIY